MKSSPKASSGKKQTKRDIEIPYEKDRGKVYRFFEILPGMLSWGLLLLPFILSFIDVTVAAFFILVYLLVYISRAVGGNFRVIQGYRTLKRHQGYDWPRMLQEMEDGKVDEQRKVPDWHKKYVEEVAQRKKRLRPSDMYHAIVIATYNESREVLEPTIQSVIASRYDMKQVILVLAYEERGGKDVELQAKALMREYKGAFKHAMAVKHPKGIPGEIKGKGGNITYAGRELQKYLEKESIDPHRVIVTTLDADNRPNPQYLPALSYVYAVYPDTKRIAVQPITMYTNNIWDAPAPMRVIATGNTFFNLVQALRPHALRNFSAHAQAMDSLIATDFWSVRTIVEDGHQFWRSYFAFDGDYRVLPLYVPIYQDAVLATGYMRTLKAQFIQLRRWTWGASDIAYVVNQGFLKPNKVPRFDLYAKTLRLMEGHVTWAVGPIISLFAGFIPALFNPDNYSANELPLIVSNLQRFALIGLLASVFIALKTLPPRPVRYKNHRTFFMLLQWVYLPVTTIGYNSVAALYSQTRLMFGKYLGFDTTEKAVVTSSGNKKS